MDVSVINKLDAIVMPAIKDRNLTAPPASPSEGDRYLVAAGGSGDWTGQDGNLAMYYEKTWTFLTPKEGWAFWVDDENTQIVYDGAAWTAAYVPSIGGTFTGGIAFETAETGTQSIITITPSAALDASAHWDGIKLDLTALDPGGAGASIHGVHVDASGVDLTNDPELFGFKAEGPAAFAGEIAKSMGQFSAYGLEVHLCEGLDNHALHVLGPAHFELDATGIGAGETLAALLVQADMTGVTDGDVHGLQVTGIVGAGNQSAVGVDAGWDVIHQHTGIYAVSNKAWKVSGAAWTDTTVAFGAAGTDVEIFSADNDYIYISGVAAGTKFDSLEVILATPGDKAVQPLYEFWNGAAWTPFIPIDGTSQFTSNGIITWDEDALTGWAQSNENAEGVPRYWIRIKRQRNNLPTPPIEDTIKVLLSVTYGWDVAGDLDIHDLTVATNIALGGTVDGVDLAGFKTAYDAHTHDGRYYTETEIDTWRAGTTVAEMGYVHGVTSDIQDQLDALGGGGGVVEKVLIDTYEGNGDNDRKLDLGDDYDEVRIYVEESKNSSTRHLGEAYAVGATYGVHVTFSADHRGAHLSMGAADTWFQGKLFGGDLNKVLLGDTGGDDGGTNELNWTYRVIAKKYSSIESL